MSNIFTGSMEPFESNPASQQLSVSNMHSGLMSPMFSTPMSQEMLTSCKQEHSESMSNNPNFQLYSAPNSEVGRTHIMHASSGQEKLSLPNKRKATTELTMNNHNLQKVSITNKRAAQAGSSPKSFGMPQLSALSKRTPEMQSKSPRTGISTKKVMQIESTVSKSQPNVSKNRNMQPEAPSAVPADTSESVRAKLRESLTAALALVSQQKASSLDEENKTENEAAMIPQKGESKSLGSPSGTANTTITGSVTGPCGASDPNPSDKCNDAQSVSQEGYLKDTPGEVPQAWKFVGQEFQVNPVLPGEDTSFGDGFYFKDDLLQGNGLSWAMDLDTQIPEVQEVESTQNGELAHHDVSEHIQEQTDQSPDFVALKIESELFKLFGGVNKKYKEKGRSLLFNLKDRNNPELRERVMSGEISPERLCAMTAEELASKELSQWRMAKAEELDHMKVLPDSEVDMRRLVKKTHKGEYEVEFDQDVTVVEDVSHDTDIVPQNRRKKSGIDATHHRKFDNAKDDRDGQCRITIPGDGADLQGLMVDDVRDLPPILSLDEFMESLDKEPPFENLPVDPGSTTPVSDRENSEVRAESKSPVIPSEDPVESTLQDKKEVGPESMKQDADVKHIESQLGSDANNIGHQTKVDHVWEGLLQLSLSSMVNVLGIYKSGEKASTKEWPGLLEIKGRVRLDPFDKFLQELPMSRSRAMMVAHFLLKEGCTDSERNDLMELIDSYNTDQRLGFAEPAPGVELYLCPPRSRPVDMVINHLPKEFTENLNDIDNGLIGLLVWRKERITSAISPNSSQPKHTTKGQPLTSGRQQPDKDVIHRNVNFASRVAPQPPSLVKSALKDDDDDVPPGFGPSGGGSRDDDDLPEFNFSGGPNPPRSQITNQNSRMGQGTGSHQSRPGAPSRQVEQMRELIQRYGHSGASARNAIPVQPWNNDDDDDIPEWQPLAPHQPHQPLVMPQTQPMPKPALRPHLNQPFLQQPFVPLAKPMQPLQPPMVAHGTWWPPAAPGSNSMQPPSSTGGRPMGGQFYGAPVSGNPRNDWRPPSASSRNRGF